MITTLQEFNVLRDHRGQLIALEANKQVLFDIKRVFYLYGTQGGVPIWNRSCHKTKQFFVSVAGCCKVSLDNEKENYSILSTFVHDNFPLTPSGIIHKFDLDYPSEKTFLCTDVASCVQAGQNDYPWEKLDELEKFRVLKKELT